MSMAEGIDPNPLPVKEMDGVSGSPLCKRMEGYFYGCPSEYVNVVVSNCLPAQCHGCDTQTLPNFNQILP